jgi:hypothetical protein
MSVSWVRQREREHERESERERENERERSHACYLDAFESAAKSIQTCDVLSSDSVNTSRVNGLLDRRRCQGLRTFCQRHHIPLNKNIHQHNHSIKCRMQHTNQFGYQNHCSLTVGLGTTITVTSKQIEHILRLQKTKNT